MTRTVDQALTVAQLIEFLKNEDQTLPVFFAYNYGDHVHTIVLGQVEEVMEGKAEWSGYHEMFAEVDPDFEPEFVEGDDIDDTKISKVLILR